MHNIGTMDLDLSLNQELFEIGTKSLEDCLSTMQIFWAKCSASNVKKRKEWAEIVGVLKDLPLKFKINELRREIISMWDRCFKSEQERGRFSEFHSNDYSESILKRHQEELEILKAFYIQHKELIELVAKYEEMWKSVLAIQEQAHNPERLFKNRGAQLLKEEHDRKLISKIPQMQNTILKAIKKKEMEGVIFLIRGEHFSEIISKHNTGIGEKKTVKRTPMTSSLLLGPSSKKARTIDHIGSSNVDNTRSHGKITQGHRKAVRQLEMK